MHVPPLTGELHTMSCCPAGDVAAVRVLVCGNPMAAKESVREATGEALILLRNVTSMGDWRQVEEVSRSAPPAQPVDLQGCCVVQHGCSRMVVPCMGFGGCLPLVSELPAASSQRPACACLTTCMGPCCIYHHPFQRTGEARSSNKSSWLTDPATLPPLLVYGVVYAMQRGAPRLLRALVITAAATAVLKMNLPPLAAAPRLWEGLSRQMG